MIKWGPKTIKSYIHLGFFSILFQEQSPMSEKAFLPSKENVLTFFSYSLHKTACSHSLWIVTHPYHEQLSKDFTDYKRLTPWQSSKLIDLHLLQAKNIFTFFFISLCSINCSKGCIASWLNCVITKTFVIVQIRNKNNTAFPFVFKRNIYVKITFFNF